MAEFAYLLMETNIVYTDVIKFNILYKWGRIMDYFLLMLFRAILHMHTIGNLICTQSGVKLIF